MDETHVKVTGVWRYVYRAVDGSGQVSDVYISVHRDIAAARTFFTTAIAGHGEPDEVVSDRAAALANVIEDLSPSALHNRVKYANNRNSASVPATASPIDGYEPSRCA